jgi:hypothetical protein
MAARAWNPPVPPVTQGLKRDVLAQLTPLFPTMAGSLAAVALFAFLAVKRRDLRLSFAAFLSVPVLALTVNFGALQAYAETRSARGLAAAIAASLPAGAELACLRCLPNGLPFYRQNVLTVVSDSGREFTSNYVLFALASGQAWPEHLVPTAGLDLWLATRTRPVYLLARQEHAAELEAVAGRQGLAAAAVGSGYRAVLIPAPSSNPSRGIPAMP